jgi:hypothetical protein
MENNKHQEHIKYIKKISNTEYLKFLEINASQSRLQNQYLIWLNAGVISIAYPKILNLISMINSKYPYLLLISIISFFVSLAFCFRGLYLSSKILDYRTSTLDKLRLNGEETKEIEDNDKIEEKYRIKAKCNSILIYLTFILGLSILLFFTVINYKIINN